MLQINIKSIKKNILNIYVKYLFNLFKNLQIEYSFISLPTKKKRITLLKSPHVYKKAREQFQLNLYKKTITIKKFKTFKIFNYLLLNKPKLLNLKIRYIGK